MTPGGWIIMILSVAGVTAFFGFNLFLVFTRPEVEDLHSTIEETPDQGKPE